MRQMATVKIQTMKEVFAPMARILAWKRTDMKMATLAVKNLQDALKEKPLPDLDMQLNLIEELEDQVDAKVYKERGFEGHEQNN